jgi:hypothetical protein
MALVADLSFEVDEIIHVMASLAQMERLSVPPMHLFPASLIPEGEIMIGVGQHVPFSFLPELEGDAIRLEDFFRRVAEVSSPLVRCFRAPEQSAMLHPINPRNRLLTISVKLQKPNFGDPG